MIFISNVIQSYNSNDFSQTGGVLVKLSPALNKCAGKRFSREIERRAKSLFFDVKNNRDTNIRPIRQAQGRPERVEGRIHSNDTNKYEYNKN